MPRDGGFRTIIEPRPGYRIARELLAVTNAALVEQCVAGGARPPFDGLAQRDEPGFDERFGPIVEGLCEGTAPTCQ